MDNKILVVGSAENLSRNNDWQDLKSGLSLNFAESIVDAERFLIENGADCVLVADPFGLEAGFEILEAVQNLSPSSPVIFWCSSLTASEAVKLIQAGASHCFDSRDSVSHLKDAIVESIEQGRTNQKRGSDGRRSQERWRETLVGESNAMEKVAETIRLVGPRRCTVLITGETGTGKEMAARALHLAGPRAQQPFVAINCSALPENLLEAELFGHTKGAFTGATQFRTGRFEQANRGTIFLDEIGDMPLELQAKLLRVLQDREFQRLGSSESVRIDVRVIAATNVDLEARIKQGLFRADLFYRINVVPLVMPPLRARTTDIPVLVSHFINKFCAAENLPPKALLPDTLRRICASPWPGNVRQLENAVEMAVAVSGTRDVLYTKDFGLADSGPRSSALGVVHQFSLPATETVDFETAVSEFQLAILDSALRRSGGNKTMAAQQLGIKRTTLIMKMRSLESAGFLLRAS